MHALNQVGQAIDISDTPERNEWRGSAVLQCMRFFTSLHTLAPA